MCCEGSCHTRGLVGVCGRQAAESWTWASFPYRQTVHSLNDRVHEWQLAVGGILLSLPSAWQQTHAHSTRRITLSFTCTVTGTFKGVDGDRHSGDFYSSFQSGVEERLQWRIGTSEPEPRRGAQVSPNVSLYSNITFPRETDRGLNKNCKKQMAATLRSHNVKPRCQKRM